MEMSHFNIAHPHYVTDQEINELRLRVAKEQYDGEGGGLSDSPPNLPPKPKPPPPGRFSVSDEARESMLRSGAIMSDADVAAHRQMMIDMAGAPKAPRLAKTKTHVGTNVSQIIHQGTANMTVGDKQNWWVRRREAGLVAVLLPQTKPNKPLSLPVMSC